MRARHPAGERAARRGRAQEPLAPGAPKRHRRSEHGRRANRPVAINLARALGKPHLRVAAFDDGAFTRRHRYAPVAGVVYAPPGLLDALVRGRVRVDGLDATETIVALWAAGGFGEGPRAILLDGISLGGFNLIDLDRLHRATGRPVVSITRRRPEYAEMRRALATYFSSTLRERWRRLRAHRLFPVLLNGSTRFLAAVGCSRAEAALLVRRVTVRGAWPEPLRLAGLLARASTRTIKPPRAAPRLGPVA